MSIRRILAALALETHDDPVVARATQLAAQHGARLILVHGIEDANFHDPDLSAPVDAADLAIILKEDAVRRIRGSAEQYSLAVPVEIFVETGRPDEIIDDQARRNAVDLVVIGAGKARNLREKVFGSTVDRVVRSASSPVLVVKCPLIDPYRRIVAAVDFSSQSASAARAAARIAPAATVELVHVVEIPLAFEQALRKAGTAQMEIERYRKAKSLAARSRLREVFKDMGQPPGGPRLRVVQGDAGAALVRLSRRRRNNLIALGATGRHVAARFLLGSVARKVLLEASCDVLVSPD